MPGRGTQTDDAHEWLSFEDEDEERTWVFDVTFLTSNWSCIFGYGCQGVLTSPYFQDLTSRLVLFRRASTN